MTFDEILDSLKLPPHPCVVDGCDEMVDFDDEPWCFTHSPDSGSSVPGYSWKAEQDEIDRQVDQAIALMEAGRGLAGAVLDVVTENENPGEPDVRN